MKLHVRADNAFFYPDVFVVASPESGRAHSHAKSLPTLVAEVLSPATSAYDRGAKFAAYRKLPSLGEYVLIDPERLSVGLFRRDDPHDRWVLHPFEAQDTVEFASVGLTLPMASVYEDARLDRAAARSAHP